LLAAVIGSGRSPLFTVGDVIHSEVVIVGGGLAGLSAAIYLGRAKRDTLLVDSARSMARWEPRVQNYLGFAHGVSGEQLLERGRSQAECHGVRFRRDVIRAATAKKNVFVLQGERNSYACRRLLLATGIFHLPPDIPGITPCLGHSMFFCKDCDGYRVQGKSVAIYGWTNETAEYALGMLLYSPCVAIVTDGRAPRWDQKHASWLAEYKIPVWQKPIVNVSHRAHQLLALMLQDGTKVENQALFTTRGDIYLNKLAKCLGAKVDEEGQVMVDADMRTSVERVYAAGCVTPANCQMIIAAGQGATAAQAINRDLLEESLVNHSLRRFRGQQLRAKRTRPKVSK
jgi:thioredoxin reductase (NADPH)